MVNQFQMSTASQLVFQILSRTCGVSLTYCSQLTRPRRQDASPDGLHLGHGEFAKTILLLLLHPKPAQCLPLALCQTIVEGTLPYNLNFRYCLFSGSLSTATMGLRTWQREVPEFGMCQKLQSAEDSDNNVI